MYMIMFSVERISIGTMPSNDETIRRGIELAVQAATDSVLRHLPQYSTEVIGATLRGATYTSFTGNTINSYGCLIYRNGVNVMDITTSSLLGRPPVARKVGKGERLYLETPYAGEARSVYGREELESDTAKEAIDIVRSYPVNPAFNVTARFTVATEYQQWLGADSEGRSGHKSGVAPFELMRQLAQLKFTQTLQWH